MNTNLWQTLNGLCKKNRQVQDRINELYGRISFPYKIRSKFAEWIENQDWDTVDLEDDLGKRKAENLYKELILKIDGIEEGLRKGQSYDLENTLDLGRAKDCLKKSFDGNYCTFVNVIRNCLAEERVLIESCETDPHELKRKVRAVEIDMETFEIQQKLSDLQEKLALIGQNIDDVQSKQGKFKLDYMEKEEKRKQLISQLSKGRQLELETLKTEIEKEMQRNIMENYEYRKKMVDDLVILANNLNDIRDLVWKEIDKWNLEQKQEITALSRPAESDIDRLDKLCNEFGDVLIKMIQHLSNALTVLGVIKYSDETCEIGLQKTLDGFLTIVLQEHLQRVFVVERNIPDRVLKVSSGKSLGFSMILRLLGGNGLGLSFSPPKVTMSLFHEKNIPSGDEYTEGACQILNGHERTFIINRGTNSCTASFHSVQLKNVKRPDRGKNEELVTEHKYAFLFFTTVSVCGLKIQLKLVSLPVILTSQTSQEIMAKGTLVWDAAFSDERRKQFEYKEAVPWFDVAQVLNALFTRNTGRSLTQEHLLYLAKMAFKHRESRRTGDGLAVDFDNKLITEKQVIKDRLNGRDFSFWKWFYACMNLVIHHIKREWQDGKIYGFISKDDARKKLKDSPCGTFLLRFSESNIENSQKSDICGFLTVAVMEIDPESGQKKLFHVKDYLSPKEIHEKGLAPILDAMEVAEFTDGTKKKRLLQFLYPHANSKFEDVFGAYIKQKESSDDGYRRGKYSIEIFLTDDKSRRARQDSVDGSVCDAASCPPSVQSSTSINSPIYDMSEWNEGPGMSTSTGTMDAQQLLLMMPVNCQQRPLAAVKPHLFTTPSNVLPYGQQPGLATHAEENLLFNSFLPGQDVDLNPFLSTTGEILDDLHLEEMLTTDMDGDLVIAPDYSGNSIRFQL